MIRTFKVRALELKSHWDGEKDVPQMKVTLDGVTDSQDTFFIYTFSLDHFVMGGTYEVSIAQVP